MSGPEVVRVKRKRTEHAPEALLVERPGKRQHTVNVHYILQKTSSSSLLDPANNDWRSETKDGQRPLRDLCHDSGGVPSNASKEKRTFHLKRSSTPEVGVRKRRQKVDSIATFVEQQSKQNAQDVLDSTIRGQSVSNAAPSSGSILKRPGKGAAIRAKPYASSATTPQSTKGGQVDTSTRINAMADSLHQFAVEEAAKESTWKPKVTLLPRLPPERSRELHRQRVAQPEAPKAVSKSDSGPLNDEDGEYVYDTYVLASDSGSAATQIGAQDGNGNVGYLVITEEDEDIWGTYIEDEPSDPSDEDDENAEDWYGADYPDEELASDDELGQNPYRYRSNGSDNEWEESGTFSDEEFERQTQPWLRKTPQQFLKYFSSIDDDDAETQKQ